MVQLLEEYAKENSIPIMLSDGIEFLKNFIKDNDIKNVLEIGTAIGYSAIQMCLASSDVSVTTIEKDEARYNIAIKNIKDFNLDSRINAICADALDIEITGTYDLIFIDAAKAQSIKFFNKFENLLNKNGYIITDNLAFHGLVNSNEKMSRNLRQLVRKINNYIEFLKENKDYDTKFYEVGDGISISKKR
jgi:predicted O-methyltransferase YrrM